MKKLTTEQKIALGFIIFGICALGIFSVSKYVTAKNTIKLNGVELRAEDYNIIKERFKDYTTIKICNLESKGKECIGLINIDDIRQIQNLPSSSETSSGGGEVR